jgi:hypothetical protein
VAVAIGVDHLGPAARRPDHRQAVGQAGAKAHPAPVRHLGRSGKTVRAPFDQLGDPVRRGRRGQPAQFHRSRHPQPPRHRAQVEPALGQAGRPRQPRRGHVPFDMIAALGVQRHGIAGLTGQIARMRPGGDHHPAGVQVQPRPLDRDPVDVARQPLGPGAQMRRPGRNLRRQRPHHRPRVRQEDRLRKEGRPASGGRPGSSCASSSPEITSTETPRARRPAISALAAATWAGVR